MAKGKKKSKRGTVVAPTCEMDAQTFIMHFNARHMPMAGLQQLRTTPLFLDPNEGALRAYHSRIHNGLHGEIADGHTHPRDKEPAA